MELGHGQRRSVLILWAWTALLSAFVLYPVLTGSDVSYLPIGAAMLGLVLYTVLHPQIRRSRTGLRRRVAVRLGSVCERRRRPDRLCTRSQARPQRSGRRAPEATHRERHSRPRCQALRTHR